MAGHSQQDLPAGADNSARAASDAPAHNAAASNTTVGKAVTGKAVTGNAAAGNAAYRKRAPGGPGYHDPTAGIGGAAPARSALTLRLILAGFGTVVCAAGAVLLALAGVPSAWVVTLAVLALVAAIDVVVVVRLKRQPF